MRAAGATPATVALAGGDVIIGAGDDLLRRIATEEGVAKRSLRDIAPVVARRGLGATRVAATVDVAARAGLSVMMTGGIGGAHRGAEHLRCAGGPAGDRRVSGVRGVRWREACARSHPHARGARDPRCPGDRIRHRRVSGLLHALKRSASRAPRRRPARRGARRAGAARARRGNGGRGAHRRDTLDRASAEAEVRRAIAAAERDDVRGPRLTPYLLEVLGEATSGRALAANVAPLQANARVAGTIALALASA